MGQPLVSPDLTGPRLALPILQLLGVLLSDGEDPVITAKVVPPRRLAILLSDWTDTKQESTQWRAVKCNNDTEESIWILKTYESDSSELDSAVRDCSAFHLLYLSTSSVRYEVFFAWRTISLCFSSSLAVGLCGREENESGKKSLSLSRVNSHICKGNTYKTGLFIETGLDKLLERFAVVSLQCRRVVLWDEE